MAKLTNEYDDLINSEEGKNIPTWRAAYSDRTALLMAKLSFLPYKLDFAQLKKLLSKVGFEVLKTYETGIAKGILAKSSDFAVLVLRGSVSIEDWRTNFNFKLSEIETDIGIVRIHSGFLEAYREFEAELHADIKTLIGDNIGLYTTGHSLGGALAQIASAALKIENLAACYSFGAPRIGTQKFDEYVKCPHYRIVNSWDVVPTIPYSVFGRYQHSGDARYLRKLGQRPLRRSMNSFNEIIRQIIGLSTIWMGANNPLIKDHQMSEYIAKLRAIVEIRN